MFCFTFLLNQIKTIKFSHPSRKNAKRKARRKAITYDKISSFTIIVPLSANAVNAKQLKTTTSDWLRGLLPLIKATRKKTAAFVAAVWLYIPFVALLFMALIVLFVYFCKICHICRQNKSCLGVGPSIFHFSIIYRVFFFIVMEGATF